MATTATKFDKLHTSVKYLSGQLFFMNFMLIIIWFSNIGVDYVNVTNTVDVKTKYSNDIPLLYCSSDNIFYFESTFTVVVDDKNKPKKCSEKNKTYVYSREYGDYKVEY